MHEKFYKKNQSRFWSNDFLKNRIVDSFRVSSRPYQIWGRRRKLPHKNDQFEIVTVRIESVVEAGKRSKGRRRYPPALTTCPILTIFVPQADNWCLILHLKRLVWKYFVREADSLNNNLLGKCFICWFQNNWTWVLRKPNTLWVQKLQNHHIPMNILTKEIRKLV